MHSPIAAEFFDALVHGNYRQLPWFILHMVIDLSQQFTRKQLVDALIATTEDFPLLKCRYEPGGFRDKWIAWDGPVEKLLLVTDATGASEIESATRFHFNLTFAHLVEPQFRVGVINHESACRIILSVHHMVTDGGGLKALATVFGTHLYGAGMVAGVNHDRRIQQTLKNIPIVEWPLLISEMVRETVQPMAMARVKRFSPPFKKVNGNSRPLWHNVFFDTTVTEAFHAFCRRNNATVNDGLVALLLRMAAKRQDKERVGTAYTIDIRRHLRDHQFALSNLSAVGFVTARKKQLEEPSHALLTVASIINRHKSRAPGLGFILFPLITTGWFPHALLRVAGRVLTGRMLGYMDRTLALTNIGSLDKALAPYGDNALKAYIAGPVGNQVPIPIVTVSGFKGTLTCSVGASGRLDKDEVQKFAENLSGELRRFG